VGAAELLKKNFVVNKNLNLELGTLKKIVFTFVQNIF